MYVHISQETARAIVRHVAPIAFEPFEGYVVLQPDGDGVTAMATNLYMLAAMRFTGDMSNGESAMAKVLIRVLREIAEGTEAQDIEGNTENLDHWRKVPKALSIVRSYDYTATAEVSRYALEKALRRFIELEKNRQCSLNRFYIALRICNGRIALGSADGVVDVLEGKAQGDAVAYCDVRRLKELVRLPNGLTKRITVSISEKDYMCRLTMPNGAWEAYLAGASW